jgi:hypothetical protein
MSLKSNGEATSPAVAAPQPDYAPEVKFELRQFHGARSGTVISLARAEASDNPG